MTDNSPFLIVEIVSASIFHIYCNCHSNSWSM